MGESEFPGGVYLSLWVPDRADWIEGEAAGNAQWEALGIDLANVSLKRVCLQNIAADVEQPIDSLSEVRRLHTTNIRI